MKRAWVCAAILVMVSALWVGNSPLTAAAAGNAADEAAIRKVLEGQAAEWNRGDLDAFMTGYWNSPDVEFVSGGGVTRGYAGVLARYKQVYRTQEKMGKLTFTDLDIHVECSTSAYAVGQFHLELPPDNPTGWFTLNFRKFKDGWKVVVDHTSSAPKKTAQ
jgi:beta-aspartyl-peptidase (threonine type)